MPPESWQSAPPSYPNNNPPASPPPQIPSPPYMNATPELGLPTQPELASQYIKPRRRWVVPTLITAGVLMVATAGVLLVQAYRNNPATIFNQALSNSLNTKWVQESVSSDALDATLTLDTGPKDPRVSSLTTKSLGANTYVKGYGSLQNTYISYASDPTNSTTTPTTLLDQWIQVRSGGSLPAGLTLNPLFATSDPRYQVAGSWVFGGLSSKDRSNLLKLAKSSKLYQIDAQKITPTTVNGHAVLVYSLSVDGSKLKAYETQAGAIFGVPQSDIATVTQGLSGATVSLKVYIRKDTRQVVEVDSTVRGLTTRVTYGSFNTAKVAAEPKADLSYSEYLKQLGS